MGKTETHLLEVLLFREKSLESKLVTCSFSCRNRTLLQIYSNRVDDTESVVSVMQISPELELYV